jgi:hypothetical protein
MFRNGYRKFVSTLPDVIGSEPRKVAVTKQKHDGNHTERRKDDYVQTIGGTMFWPMDPRADEISIDDIAHALSQQCRYAGHTPGFYSVAQHLVVCCDQAVKLCPDLALTVLMHDASEAYLSDLPRPVKRMLSGYLDIERTVEQAIPDKYGLAYPYPAIVRLIDNRMLALLPTAAEQMVEVRPRLHVRAVRRPAA